ncbi:ketopantoate reductase family protein [Novosphingobium sp. PP1Y]|uniref:ketopantoate reductase family protein n=1 Tax=Novosphingobium sp. PP1Y TaxID=702113 RepID=UPI00020EF9F8|nr:ketopantoate reductase family protein [Novosphingobium sp. PP1Y]CCA90686.1 2-dehydropantoate 2-reductase [Novosphingobium sp. PP1Y]
MSDGDANLVSNVLVLGAGAMGCYFAARLIEGGTPVTLVDIDEARIGTLNSSGLTVVDDRGTRNVPVRASTAAALHVPANLVIVFTKGIHTATAMQQIAHLVGPDTFALTLQNGLGNAQTIAETLSRDRVMFGVTDVPADLVPPTEVHSQGKGKITFWSLDEAGAPQAHVLHALFEAAGMQAMADPSAEIAVWEKVAFNAALNAPSAILECPVGGLDTNDGRAIVETVVEETVAVAHASKIAVDPARIMARVNYALATHREHKPSMLQDIQAKRRTEIDLINGAIVAAGEAVGVSAPVTATLVHLVRAKEGFART